MATPVEDLELSVRREGDTLVVRVARSPAGTTAEQRVDAAALDAVVPGADGTTPTRDIGAPDAPPTAGRLGVALFRAAFDGAVGERWRVSGERAAVAGATLRLVLRLDAAADALPWELLTDPATTTPLALRHPVVRAIDGADEHRPAIGGPLRVLAVVAAPVGTGPVDAAAEVAGLRDALGRLVESGAVDLHVVTATSLAALTRALGRGPWHVVHYIGHGTRAPDGVGALVLHDDGAGHDLVSGGRLGAVLAGSGDVRLVVLNACRTAVPAGPDLFAGSAAALVRAGVPTVVAMRAAVTDEAAVLFAGALYGGLVGGATVEGAVTSARRLLHGSPRVADEWATPVVSTGGRVPATPLTPPTDDDVGFTVARPGGLRASRWETMLVFAHRRGPHPGGRGETVDPVAQIEARIQRLFGDEAAAASRTTVAAAGAIPRGTDLVVEADVPGVETVVRDSPVTWRGETAEALVQLRARVALAGRTVDGWVRVFSGPLLVAEAAVDFVVVAPDEPAPPAATPAPMRRFRRIFPCFSPDDADLVRGLAATAEALGDVEYVDGVLGEDPGAPDDWMVTALRDADVFQLFWSTSSMTSGRCRRQWQAAVALDRPDFVRPLYWERPMPRAPDLPPPELGGLRFVAIPMPAAPTAPAVPPSGDRPGATAPGSSGTPSPPPPMAPPGRVTDGEGPTIGRPAPAGRSRSPLTVAALVLLGGVTGLVVAATSSTPASPSADVGTSGSSLRWWLAVVVGLLVGALAALVLVLWRRRGGRAGHRS